jgi:hypothetical protein
MFLAISAILITILTFFIDFAIFKQVFRGESRVVLRGDLWRFYVYERSILAKKSPVKKIPG